MYGAAALLLLVAVLFARGFSREVGDARVSGRFSALPLLRSRVPEQLALTWNGLTLRFARGTSPALQGFEADGPGTDLVFDDGARLRLAPGSDTGGSLTLTPQGAGVSTDAAVVVPFSLEGVMLSPPPGAALAWKRSGREFLLTLPQGAHTDLAAGTLTLPLTGAASAVLQVQGVAAASRPMEIAAAARAPQESAMPTVDRLQAALATWTDHAWQGWSATRYVAADGTWRLADGSAGFSEDTGIALCAEAIARGAWQAAFPLWSDAVAHQRAQGTQMLLGSSVYIGGERDFARAYRARVTAQVSQAAASLARSDASVLSTPDLVTLLVDHGTADQVQALGAFLDGRAPTALDLPASVGFVQAALDYQRLVSADSALARLARETVERRILPAARPADGGVFLDGGSGRVDVRASVAAGALLLRAGDAAGSTLYRAVGRGLVVSALALADDRGFLPATVALSGGRITSRDGGLPPEALYGILPLDRRIPREVPLPSRAGAGAWVYTSAGVVSATPSGSGFSVVLSYPRGVPYHLVIGGLKPFTLLKLHGIPWHSDPTYFKYSDGWDYDAETRTLLMKITGRTDQEQVDLTF